MYEMDKYTVSLLHFDDGIKDETGKVWVAQNGAAVVTENSKFGNSSIYFNGVQQSIQTPASKDFVFGTSDFTVDLWMNWSGQFMGTSKAATLFGQNPGQTTNVRLSLFPGGILKLYCNNDSTILFESPSNTIIADKWMHVALVKHGDNFLIFIDGKLLTSVEYKLSLAMVNYPWEIGNEENADCGYKGYLDEFRISNIARWTEDFVPNNPPTPNPEAGEFLLTVTLAEEVEREYPVTKAELDAFVKWYDTKTTSTGLTYYTFDKFLNRKDYLVFDKILTFQVTDFTK